LEGVTGEVKRGSRATGAVQAGRAWVLEARDRGAEGRPVEAGVEEAEAEVVEAGGDRPDRRFCLGRRGEEKGVPMEEAGLPLIDRG
jgi:hypothetical protein